MRTQFDDAELARANWQDAYETIQSMLAHPTCSPELKKIAAAYRRFSAAAGRSAASMEKLVKESHPTPYPECVEKGCAWHPYVL